MHIAGHDWPWLGIPCYLFLLCDAPVSILRDHWDRWMQILIMGSINPRSTLQIKIHIFVLLGALHPMIAIMDLFRTLQTVGYRIDSFWQSTWKLTTVQPTARLLPLFLIKLEKPLRMRNILVVSGPFQPDYVVWANLWDQGNFPGHIHMIWVLMSISHGKSHSGFLSRCEG